MKRPKQSAAELGYRMPGEFEAMEAVWLCRPRNRETWPGCFEEASAQHADFVEKLEKVVTVELIGRDHKWRCNDSWIRDYGPIYVVGPARTKDRRTRSSEPHPPAPPRKGGEF